MTYNNLAKEIRRPRCNNLIEILLKKDFHLIRFSKILLILNKTVLKIFKINREKIYNEY